MMFAIAGVGSTYAALLWLAAQHVARVRALALGAWPHVAILLCGVVAALVARQYPLETAALLSATLIGTVVCALVDARTGYIFDVLSLIVMSIAAILSVASNRLSDGALGATLVGGSMFALYLASGRRGVGLGDVKLAAVIALGFGLKLGSIAVGCAFVLGAIYGVALLASRQARRTDTVRFGPFLAGGAMLALAADTLGFSG